MLKSFKNRLPEPIRRLASSDSLDNEPPGAASPILSAKLNMNRVENKQSKQIRSPEPGPSELNRREINHNRNS